VGPLSGAISGAGAPLEIWQTQNTAPLSILALPILAKPKSKWGPWVGPLSHSAFWQSQNTTPLSILAFIWKWGRGPTFKSKWGLRPHLAYFGFAYFGFAYFGGIAPKIKVGHLSGAPLCILAKPKYYPT
jgi:hypothetical protein